MGCRFGLLFFVLFCVFTTGSFLALIGTWAGQETVLFDFQRNATKYSGCRVRMLNIKCCDPTPCGGGPAECKEIKTFAELPLTTGLDTESVYDEVGAMRRAVIGLTATSFSVGLLVAIALALSIINGTFRRWERALPASTTITWLIVCIFNSVATQNAVDLRNKIQDIYAGTQYVPTVEAGKSTTALIGHMVLAAIALGLTVLWLALSCFRRQNAMLNPRSKVKRVSGARRTKVAPSTTNRAASSSRAPRKALQKAGQSAGARRGSVAPGKGGRNAGALGRRRSTAYGGPAAGARKSAAATPPPAGSPGDTV